MPSSSVYIVTAESVEYGGGGENIPLSAITNSSGVLGIGIKSMKNIRIVLSPSGPCKF